MLTTAGKDEGTSDTLERRGDFGIGIAKCASCRRLIANRGCFSCKQRLCMGSCFLEHCCPAGSLVQDSSESFIGREDSLLCHLASVLSLGDSSTCNETCNEAGTI